MTAQSDDRTGVSEVDFGGKSGLNLTPCEDLPKVGGDFNDFLHGNAEEIDVELKYIDDISTNFFDSNFKTTKGEPMDEEKTVSKLNVGSEQVHIEELGGKIESCDEGTVVSSAKQDVTAEDSEYQTNGDELRKSDTVEERKGVDSIEVIEGDQESVTMITEVVGSAGDELEKSDTVEEQNGLDSAEIVGDEESLIVITEAVGSIGDEIENSDSVEEKNGLESAEIVGDEESLIVITEVVGSIGDEIEKNDTLAEIVEGDEESLITITEVVESIGDVIEKNDPVEEQNKLDSAEIVEGDQESLITITEAVGSDVFESEIHLLNNGEAKVEEEGKFRSEETNVESKVHQLDNGEEKETAKPDGEIPMAEPSGHIEAEQEMDLETDATKEKDETGESVPTEVVGSIGDEIEKNDALAEIVEGDEESLISITEVVESIGDVIEKNDPVVEHNKLDSAEIVEGDQESLIMITETLGYDVLVSKIRPLNNGEAKVEEEGKLRSEETNVESEEHQLHNGKEKETAKLDREIPVAKPSGHIEAEQEMDLETDATKEKDETGESMPTCTVELTVSETKVINDSAEGQESTSMSPIVEIELESSIGNGSPENSKILTYHADDLKSESEVGDVASVERDESVSEPTISDGSIESDVIAVENGEHSISGEEGEGIEEIDRNGSHPSSPKGLTPNALEGKKVDDEEGKIPFLFLVRIPKYVDDNKISDQIRLADLHHQEKTRSRNAIALVIQSKRVICREYHAKFDAAKSEERAARDALKAKHKEMEPVQAVINRMKDATSIKDIDDKISNMEHRIGHETMPLKEEKQLIHEIKQLKHDREKLRSSSGGQTEAQPTLDQRNRIEERLKILKQELDSTRNELLRTEGITKASKKIYFDEKNKLAELNAQHKAADDLQKEAYTQLRNLKNQLNEKYKYFDQYKEDVQKAGDYKKAGDKEALQHLCVNQVETIMGLWNKNDEFRNDYIRCNKMSTLRRFHTLDARSLGPDEEPLVLHNVVDKRVGNTQVTLAGTNSTLEKGKSVLPLAVKQKNAEDVKSVVNLEQKSSIAKSKKTSKPTVLENGSAIVSGIEEKTEEENKQTKEEEELKRKEEELVRKAEELRKEEEAAKSKEQHRLEEKAKARQAEERKKRKAEKAKHIAELRAQKEAELKEKEREKKMKKKERKKAATAAAAAAAESGGIEGETASNSETMTQEPEIEEKVTEVVKKKPQKPSVWARQTKQKVFLPPPLRNRSKRRMQPWMWILLLVFVVLALFLVGNSGYSSKFRLSSFGF